MHVDEPHEDVAALARPRAVERARGVEPGLSYRDVGQFMVPEREDGSPGPGARHGPPEQHAEGERAAVAVLDQAPLALFVVLDDEEVLYLKMRQAQEVRVAEPPRPPHLGEYRVVDSVLDNILRVRAQVVHRNVRRRVEAVAVREPPAARRRRRLGGRDLRGNQNFMVAVLHAIDATPA